MFKLSRRVNEGPSAVELIEASKKLYVKTEALKDTKIGMVNFYRFNYLLWVENSLKFRKITNLETLQQ
jgi:hypothetical protein